MVIANSSLRARGTAAQTIVQNLFAATPTFVNHGMAANLLALASVLRGRTRWGRYLPFLCCLQPGTSCSATPGWAGTLRSCCFNSSLQLLPAYKHALFTRLFICLRMRKVIIAQHDCAKGLIRICMMQPSPRYTASANVYLIVSCVERLGQMADTTWNTNYHHVVSKEMVLWCYNTLSK